MQLTLQHSKPATKPSTISLDQDYLADIVKRLSFPRVFGTAENARAEELVAGEFVKLFGSCFRVGKTRNVCWHPGGDVDGHVGVQKSEIPSAERHAGHPGLRFHGGSGEVAAGSGGQVDRSTDPRSCDDA